MELLTLLGLGAMGYVVALILGPLTIDYLKKQSIRQVVREEGLESHLVKTGTPVMGAFIFLIPLFVIGLFGTLISDIFSWDLVMLFVATFAFGCIGFVDDYKKVIKKHNEGLKTKEKLLAQCLVALPLSIYIGMQSTALWIPFTNYFWEIGIFKYIVAFVAVIATTNAVNLTDGVDGLSTSVTILVMTFYTYVALRLDFVGFELFTVLIIAGLLGFLMYNKNPAKIFMGDVGSLALGGAVVMLAGLTQTLLLIFIVGIIYFAETVSVTLQVLYFKKTGKRIFKMAPLHHHYELCGWHETKIVKVFSMVTVLGVVLGVLSLTWRI